MNECVDDVESWKCQMGSHFGAKEENLFALKCQLLADFYKRSPSVAHLKTSRASDFYFNESFSAALSAAS